MRTALPFIALCALATHCTNEENVRSKTASDVTAVSTLISADLSALGDGVVNLDNGVTLKKLTEFTWVYSAKKDLPGAPNTSANGVLFVSGGHALLVDTLWSDAQFDTVLRYLDKHGVTADSVLLTHAHEDRVGGLGAAIARKLLVFARRETAARIERPGFKATFIEERDRIAFEGESIEVYFPGPAHANDNIVAFRPRDSVLFAGCALKEKSASSLGNLEESDVERWPEAIFRMERAFPRAVRIVPGHGEVGGRELFTHTRELLKQDD